MLDDIIELAVDVAVESGAEVLEAVAEHGFRRMKKGKTAPEIEKEPWERQEKAPPWEG